jgi:putative transposase
VYSRYIVGWGLSNTLEAAASLQAAVAEHGKPEIVNSNQGCQFTCKEYIEYLRSEQIAISMDGKGRALDNFFIERFWRTIKYQHVYLNPADDGISLYQGISPWIAKYNQKPPQGISRNKPYKLFKIAA